MSKETSSGLAAGGNSHHGSVTGPQQGRGKGTRLDSARLLRVDAVFSKSCVYSTYTDR